MSLALEFARAAFDMTEVVVDSERFKSLQPIEFILGMPHLLIP